MFTCNIKLLLSYIKIVVLLILLCYGKEQNETPLSYLSEPKFETLFTFAILYIFSALIAP